MKQLTLRDIADALGVSIGTVDRAMHGRPDVSPETRAKVLAFAKENAYRPDAAAQMLSLRSKPLRIGILLPQAVGYRYFWDELKSGISRAAAQLERQNVRVVVRSLREESSALAAGVEKLVSEKFDAVAFVPRQNEQSRKAAALLRAAKLPFATLNDDLDESGRLFYVGPHSLQSGSVAGSLMGRFLRGNGRVVLIRNGIKSLDYESRANGFLNQLKTDFKGVELALTITLSGSEGVGFDEESAENLLLELSALPQIDGIYDASSCMLPALGKLKKVLPAMQNAVIIGHELSAETRRALERGTITATLSQNPFTQGHTVVASLADFLLDGKVPQYDKLYSRTDIILKENLLVNGQDTLKP